MREMASRVPMMARGETLPSENPIGPRWPRPRRRGADWELTVTHCTRVNRPWSMPSRTNQRRSEFNAGDGVTRPDDGAWGNHAKRESNRPAMAAAPPAGCRLGGCKPAGMQGAWAFHTEIMLRKFIARLRE